MHKKTRSKSPAPAQEHIFPESKLTPLALEWQELTAQGRHKEALLVLEQIVIGSTAMFERLAQYEDYHYTVDLPTLVSAAQTKMVEWLKAWKPKKGRLFSWLSKCSKNAFLSELSKVNIYRKRVHTTSDNLEKFCGVEDHEVDRREFQAEVVAKLKTLTCRWGDYQERQAIRFLIECMLEDGHDRQAALRTVCYAWGIGPDMAKFFYSWSIYSLRDMFYEKAYLPFTEYDLTIAATSYSLWPDLVNDLGIELAKKIQAKYGGMRIRVPTTNAIHKLRDNYRLTRDIIKSDLTPDTVAALAKKHKRAPRSAPEIYSEMVNLMNPKRTGEYDVYGDD